MIEQRESEKVEPVADSTVDHAKTTEDQLHHDMAEHAESVYKSLYGSTRESGVTATWKNKIILVGLMVLDFLIMLLLIIPAFIPLALFGSKFTDHMLHARYLDQLEAKGIYFFNGSKAIAYTEELAKTYEPDAWVDSDTVSLHTVLNPALSIRLSELDKHPSIVDVKELFQLGPSDMEKLQDVLLDGDPHAEFVRFDAGTSSQAILNVTHRYVRKDYWDSVYGRMLQSKGVENIPSLVVYGSFTGYFVDEVTVSVRSQDQHDAS
jgi:hypothetical protein